MTTNFIYFRSTIKKGHVHNNCEFSKEIKIGNKKLNLITQNGSSYVANDFSKMSNNFELYEIYDSETYKEDKNSKNIFQLYENEILDFDAEECEDFGFEDVKSLHDFYIALQEEVQIACSEAREELDSNSEISRITELLHEKEYFYNEEETYSYFENFDNQTEFLEFLENLKDEKESV